MADGLHVVSACSSCPSTTGARPAFRERAVVASILNDILGPIMVGQSSSHCAAAHRIVEIAKDTVGGDVKSFLVEYQVGTPLAGSLEHGTHMGVTGALQGFSMTDERMENAEHTMGESNIDYRIRIHDYGATHESNYKITISNGEDTHVIQAISIGGGIIEVQEIDGAKVSLAGDYHELLIYCNSHNEMHTLADSLESDPRLQVLRHSSDTHYFIEIKSSQQFDAEFIRQIEDSNTSSVNLVRVIKPVLPILSSKDMKVPFTTAEGLMKFARENSITDLSEIAILWECARGNIDPRTLFDKTDEVLKVMEGSIATGRQCRPYRKRVLKEAQAGKIPESIRAGNNQDTELTRIIECVTAVMEAKSSNTPVVAAATAGSCGTMPGAVLGYAEFNDLHKNRDLMHRALLVGGMIGAFIAENATLSAEEAGCMVETIASAAMASAAITWLRDGTIEQCLHAAQMVIEANLGRSCDALKSGTEIPCLNKNISAACEALIFSCLAKASFQQVFNLDETISAILVTASKMHEDLRCNGAGPLATTPTGIRIVEAFSHTSGLPDDFRFSSAKGTE